MQQNLFSDNSSSPEKNSALPVQMGKGKAVISKEQQAFNRLTGRIKVLQEKIKSDNEFLTLLNTYYHNKVTPEVLVLGRKKIELSHLLHEKRKGEKFSRQQNEKLNMLISQLLDDAFSVIEPDEKTKGLFAQYSDTSYEEELDAQTEEMAESFASMLFEQTGIKVNPEDLKKGTPDFEKIEESIKEQLNRNQQQKRKKTKKQLEKEAAEMKKEEIKNKSLRSIYLSLAKMLHPDREPDETLRIEKEEYMKKVTTAYNDKDLMELLRLEILWVNDHETSLENIPVDTLKIYIQLLKDQVKDLEHESFMVVENPSYSNVAEYLFLAKPQAIASIEQRMQGYINTHNIYSAAISDLEKNNRNRSVIVKCIDDFYEEMDFYFPDVLPDNFDFFEEENRKRRQY